MGGCYGLTTSGPYVKGCAFYQLTKPELVQKHKDLMVKEKTGRVLYGGQEVRKVLGLPEFQDGKVTPGNHANYDVFVQSTANNRKLVRGTTVMVRK